MARPLRACAGWESGADVEGSGGTPFLRSGWERGVCGNNWTGLFGLRKVAGRRAPHAERAVMLPAVLSLRRAGSEGRVGRGKRRDAASTLCN